MVPSAQRYGRISRNVEKIEVKIVRSLPKTSKFDRYLVNRTINVFNIRNDNFALVNYLCAPIRVRTTFGRLSDGNYFRGE